MPAPISISPMSDTFNNVISMSRISSASHCFLTLIVPEIAGSSRGECIHTRNVDAIVFIGTHSDATSVPELTVVFQLINVNAFGVAF